MIRVDPLTASGEFDIGFFASDQYSVYRNIVERYLEKEGFDEISEECVLKIANRYWHVIKIKNKQNGPK
jgi:hypothetical protein